MPSFIDSSQREWTVRLDGPTIDRVREDADPLFLLDDESNKQNTAYRLEADPALFCHVIYVLCRKQREDRYLTLEQFYEGVIGDGETIERAGEALVAAIENFTRPRKREFIRAVTKKQRAVEDLAMAKAMAKLNDPTLDERIAATVDARLDGVLEQFLTLPKNATDSPVSVA